MNKMLAYLFGDSQMEAELEECREAMERIFEQAEENPLRAKKTPLAKALKSLGIEVGDGLELDPEGMALLCNDGEEYRSHVNVLTQPDAMEKLAEQGWVAACLGDQGMTGEPTDYRIRFIDIALADTTDADKPSAGLDAVIKKGREFATTPMEPDPNNPVTHPEAPWKKTMGVGKPSAGTGPTGTPKGSARKEAKEIVSRLLVQEQHAPGCNCGFCKNKGQIQAINQRRATEKPAEPEKPPMPENLARRRGRPRRIVDMPIAGMPKKHRIPKPPVFGQ